MAIKVDMNLKLAPLVFIIFGVLMRLLPHPPNMAPITAIALFSGVYLNKRYAVILPIVALLISDYFIGFYGWTMLFVYGGFVLAGVIGMWLKRHKRPVYILGASLVSSWLFFIISNMGVWLTTSMYSKNLSGLIQCYVMAIPFLRNTILGDLLFTTTLFGLYELSKRLAKTWLPEKYFGWVY